MTQSRFVWYDLATPDPAAAARFYAAVLGWRAEPVPGMDYTLFKTGDRLAAGAMTLAPELAATGVPPHWIGHVAVDDVDRSIERVTASGGNLRFGPEDVPDVGRFALVADPDGAVFDLFKPQGDGPPEPAPMTPGLVGWHELRAAAPGAAMDFYRDMFGWERSRAIDMGPFGTYQLFAYGDADRGGVMPAPEGAPAHWLYYFVVDGAEAAMARVNSAGGRVLGGPTEVPGGAWVAQAVDAQGAAFALVSATR